MSFRRYSAQLLLYVVLFIVIQRMAKKAGMSVFDVFCQTKESDDAPTHAVD
jgi:hypothetical protein